jgi:hypothetical protein
MNACSFGGYFPVVLGCGCARNAGLCQVFSRDAVIRVFENAADVTERNERAGVLREP